MLKLTPHSRAASRKLFDYQKFSIIYRDTFSRTKILKLITWESKIKNGETTSLSIISPSQPVHDNILIFCNHIIDTSPLLENQGARVRILIVSILFITENFFLGMPSCAQLVSAQFRCRWVQGEASNLQNLHFMVWMAFWIPRRCSKGKWGTKR